MSSIEVPGSLLGEFLAEFGPSADRVAEHALRSEIARHRVQLAIAQGDDAASAVAEALGRDPGFLASVEAQPEMLAVADKPDPDGLDRRLDHWG